MESSIRLLTKLGEGSFGIVYKVMVKGEEYALKIFEEQDIINVYELEIFSRKIPGLLYSLERLIYKNKLALLLPLASCDLSQYMRRERREWEIISLANQACYSLLQLHIHGYYHLDIKPENFLLFGEKLLLSDFSLSRSHEIPTIEEEVVTVPYRPPELFNQKGLRSISYKTDSWSLGILLLELFSGERVNINQLQDIFTLYRKKKELLRKVPSSYLPLLSSLLEVNQEKRGSLLELYGKRVLAPERRLFFSPLLHLGEFFLPLLKELEKEGGTWKNFSQVITVFSSLKEKSLDKLLLLLKLILQLEEVYLPYTPRDCELSYLYSLELEILLEVKTFNPPELEIPYPHLTEEDLDRKITLS